SCESKSDCGHKDQENQEARFEETIAHHTITWSLWLYQSRARRRSMIFPRLSGAKAYLKKGEIWRCAIRP
ncbi:MAG: hypothetical protein MUE87_04990, partial [Methanothrix sp.]|nr:hypothetical protein [Methanothrix sp.]